MFAILTLYDWRVVVANLAGVAVRRRHGGLTTQDAAARLAFAYKTPKVFTYRVECFGVCSAALVSEFAILEESQRQGHNAHLGS